MAAHTDVGVRHRRGRIARRGGWRRDCADRCGQRWSGASGARERALHHCARAVGSACGDGEGQQSAWPGADCTDQRCRCAERRPERHRTHDDGADAHNHDVADLNNRHDNHDNDNHDNDNHSNYYDDDRSDYHHDGDDRSDDDSSHDGCSNDERPDIGGSDISRADDGRPDIGRGDHSRAHDSRADIGGGSGRADIGGPGHHCGQGGPGHHCGEGGPGRTSADDIVSGCSVSAGMNSKPVSAKPLAAWMSMAQN